VFDGGAPLVLVAINIFCDGFEFFVGSSHWRLRLVCTKQLGLQIGFVVHTSIEFATKDLMLMQLFGLNAQVVLSAEWVLKYSRRYCSSQSFCWFLAGCFAHTGSFCGQFCSFLFFNIRTMCNCFRLLIMIIPCDSFRGSFLVFLSSFLGSFWLFLDFAHY